MSFLDTIGQMATGAMTSSNSGMVTTLVNFVQSHGGIEGVVQSFQGKGFGEIAQSWVNIGANMPITADQIKNVIGESTLNSLGAKIGMDSNALSAQLAQHLPNVIDQLTPDGKIPSGDLMSQGLSVITSLVGAQS